jgi:YYY domain-containing protein
VAKPGDFDEKLGFELVKVYESFPRLGSFRINDLSAEEAFSVYDHPKVLIFRKSDHYNADQVRQILGKIDYKHIVRETPGKFPDHPADLKLPADRLAQQRAGGTWSVLFNTEAFYNRYPGFAVLLWYLVITIFGLFIYPILRAAMPGLDDKGYPFSKLAGMLLLALVVWQLGSADIAVTRLLILWVVISLAIMGSVFAWFQRDELKQEFRQKKNYFLMIEIFSLLLFGFFLLIRLGNPDLWHPGKGGEKPMDFAYFNAVLKSTTYPPYDPWFAGGYINYYYYGFVIVGVFVKLLGIVPAIAYNLILPTLFSFVGIGAFSAAWNLIKLNKNGDGIREGEPFLSMKRLLRAPAMWAGSSAVFLVLLLGNLGTVRMMWHGLQKLGSPAGNIDTANLIQRFLWTFAGIGDLFRGESLPFYPGDWYWVPSRVLPKSPITEFPFFTFTYADLHAHMIALPVTIFALAWVISILSRAWQIEWNWKGILNTLLTLALGAIVVGALRPTNTWDFPTYLVLTGLVLVYTLQRYGNGLTLSEESPRWWKKLLEIGLVLAVFLVLVFVLYQPFADWYGQGYSKIDPWKGDRSPFWSYFTHWGLFLFLILSWFLTESIRWMDETPLSAVKNLKPYRYWIYLFFAGVGLITVYFLVDKVVIAWLILPLAAWALILMMRPEQSDAKRFVLFTIGTALVLTVVVEVIVLRGDIERMNTVFKFYMQAWVLLGISSAAGLVWILPALQTWWNDRARAIWQSLFIILVGSAALYPLFAAAEKIDDRMTKFAPIGLNGMDYMKYAT